MVTHPITVARSGYKGTDPKKRAKAQSFNHIADDFEKKINRILLDQTEPVQVYTYHEIAQKTGYSVETVREHGISIDGGSNGFTAISMDEKSKGSA